MSSPQSLGYQLPAEWEPQEAVWLSWPTNRETWPQCWDNIQRKFAEIALVLSRYQLVYVNLVTDLQPAIEQVLRQVEIELGFSRGVIQFFDHPVNDVWVRDHGPIYLKEEEGGSIATSNWSFNGWGKKHPFELDNQIPLRIAHAFGLQSFDQPWVLEGGAIETNGVGDLLVTSNCLLNPNRNPGTSVEQIEASLQASLGIHKVHWLDGCIEGDDTDGHIDNLVRFFKPDGVLVASTEDIGNPNYKTLANLEQQCRELRLADGRSIEVRRLPLPEERYCEGRSLPLNYLNFFIGNGFVLMPTFGQNTWDARALEILSSAFPDRELVSIDCRELILEGGALHCLTQQVPQTAS